MLESLSFLRNVFHDPARALFQAQPYLCDVQRRDILNGITSVIRPRSYDFHPSGRAKELARQIEMRGISEPAMILPPAQVKAIREHLEGVMCSDPWRPHLGRFQHDKIPSEETNMGIYDVQDTLSAPHILDFLNTPLFLEVAELVLGCKPIIDNATAWWSYPNRAAAKGTQWFHRDVDSLKFIKVFLYLTDVGEEDGPHDYVMGSHRSNTLQTTKRISDEDVADQFPAEDVRSVCGPAGTVFFADTFGIHRGRLPHVNGRLLFAGAYVNVRTPHGPAHPIMPIAGTPYDPYINQVFLG